jgi:four helix bundle protein
VAGIRRFEDVVAWQRARELVREVYKLCAATALGKDFGLRNQICRAAVSVMSNIAEGFSRKTHKDFAHFLDMARGSCGEVQSLLYVALDAQYLPQTDFERVYTLANSTASLVGGFTSYLRENKSCTSHQSS